MGGDRSKGMQPAEPFTFGIALISRRSAGDRDRVRDLPDGPPECAGLLDSGVVVDFHGLRCAAVPLPRIWTGAYHRICGFAGIIRVRPDAHDDDRRNPYLTLRPHNCWVEHAKAAVLELARLPLLGSDVINQSENHSEIHGPHAQWRAEMTRVVNREGGVQSLGLAARLGLTLTRIRAVAQGEGPRTHKRHEAGPQGMVV